MNGWIPVRVAARWMTARDVVALQLVLEDGALPEVETGAHVDVEIAAGLVRQYSLTNAPGAAAEYVIGVKLENPSRGGSQAIHARMQVGDRLRISPPRNNFPLDPTGDSALLIAGGIGVTPLLSMARALEERGRSFTLHYFARSTEHLAFPEVLQAVGANCVLHLGLDPAATQAALVSLLSQRREAAHLYVCGPGPMLDLTLKRAADSGWPTARIHFERFTAIAGASAGDPAFEIVLAKRGRAVVVPEHLSIVEALRLQGIEIPISCEQGICGTCLTRVLEGEPDHRDAFLDDAEKARGDCLLPCVSRARSGRLVLDL